MGEIGQYLFNSPLEVGLRLLFIFNNTTKSLDTQRIIYYNYLLIHSSDVAEAPKSLHPDLPNRSCEMLVNRKIILKGLNLLISKGLIRVVYSKKGVKYKSNKSTDFFLTHFESIYAKELGKRAKWMAEKFDQISDVGLAKFMTDNLGKWGSEFSREYSLQEESDG